MLKNYFKITWRNLTRHRSYAIINILGLAIGIAACLLILQYVYYELSYDQFHTKKDRVYRVIQDRYDNGKLSTQWAAGAFAAGRNFKDAFPEIEDYVSMTGRGASVIKEGERIIKLERTYFASESFFRLFSYPLVQGDPQTALKELNSAVISESSAKKLFGTEKALGKTIRINQNNSYTITGVMKDIPENSHMTADVLLSYSTFIKQVGPDNNPDNAWDWDGCFTYVLLKPGTDVKALEKKLTPLVAQKNGDSWKQFNASASFYLQPVTDIHLYSNRMIEFKANGDGKTVYLLLGIAFFVVIIAWVNYINLATAKAVGRAREVGIRKAIGSQRSQLIFQFLFESALLNAIALFVALLIILAVLPAFNRMTGMDLGLGLLAGKNFMLPFFGLFLLGTFLSGIYPALVLSSFNPITVLKGTMVSTGRGALLRKSLVVFQFTASLFLLIGTLTVSRQISYMQGQELGMNIDQTLVVRGPIVTGPDSLFAGKTNAFTNELLKVPAVSKVAVSSSIPGEPVGWNAGGIRLISAPENTQKQFRVIAVDYEYIDLMGLKLIGGRKFSRDFGDKKGVIFNEAGLKLMGFDKPEEIIGKDIFFWGDTLTVHGIVGNFHQQSLRDAFEPLILRLIPEMRGYYSVKVKAADISQTLTAVRKSWDNFFPGNTFEYFFLDEHFNDQYNADRRFGQVFGIFTCMAILVACLGLFGLASFTTIQKTKEIGIRKVLGASVPSILRLLYKEFAVLIVVAFLVATPVSWYAASQWLQGYAFRINVQQGLFLIPFLIMMVVALLTVSIQTVRAALANPVNSLRTE